TGTPIRNSDCDVWAQFRFCGYTGIAIMSEWKKVSLAKFREHHLEDYIFTLSYKDADITLPPKVENDILVKLSDRPKIIYEWLLGETRNAYDDMLRGGCSFACVLEMFLRLRQCSIAPYLITADSKRSRTKLKGKALIAHR